MECDICGGVCSHWKRLQDNRFESTPDTSFDVYECDDCGTGKTVPFPDDFDPYYPEPYYDIRTEDEGEGIIERFLHRYESWVTPDILLPSKPGRLLEIGCGPGVDLVEFRSQGWQVEGVEPNPHAVELGQERYDLELFQGTLEETAQQLSSNAYDVILFNHVFEHIATPHTTIELCAELLSEDGLIVIEVPNFGSLSRKLFGEYWGDHDVPRHLYHYTPESLNHLLGTYGFELSTSSYDRRARLFAGWGADYLSAKLSIRVPTAAIFPIGVPVGVCAGQLGMTRFRHAYKPNSDD